MDIQLSLHSRQDLAGQIYRQLRTAIIEGRLAGGARLPSTRDLAEQLGVSRRTTLEAFEKLQGEGFLHSQPGRGTFVPDGLHRPTALAPEQAFVTHELRGPAPAAFWASMPELLAMPLGRPPASIDFMGGVTDKKLFPFDVWRRCMSHALRVQARERGNYKDPGGDQSLRLAIARYVGFNRALNCNWADIIVTQGAQQALDLLARTLLEPGDVVAVEEPGYPPARIAFAAAGAQIVSVPVDEQGIDTARLPANAKLVYVTPSHQFPLGRPMTIERRIALLEWARVHQALIVEDDYDGEFRFTGRPVESLASLDRDGWVAYVGTFSKTIFPELRLGYVIPPASLRSSVLKAKQGTDCHSSTLTQIALARFMLDGYFAKHLRRVHKAYAERRDTLLRHLNGPLSPWFEAIAPAAGIHLTALLRENRDESAIINAAAEADIALYGIGPFYHRTPARTGMLFGYGALDAQDIDNAMTTLATILASLDKTTRS